MPKFLRTSAIALLLLLLASLTLRSGEACTGITLKAKDGAVVYGRTMEWGSFDLRSRLITIPRGTEFVGSTPDKKPGLRWKSKFGVAGIDLLEKNLLADAMNERGLVAGMFYHPGFADYPTYAPALADRSMGPTDVLNYLLTNFSTLAEVRAGLANVRVVPVLEPAIGVPPPIHVLVTEPSGEALVIEWTKGKMTFHDAVLGAVTNAPTYDWHLTNLRNYVNLSSVSIPDKKLEDLDFKALGGGSGMMGLLGDFTPPSRFVRAVAFSQTARATKDGPETIYELFRILDNFNVPLGAAEGHGESKADDLRSSTLWTTAWDLKDKALYYRTQHNRRVRRFDLDSVNWDTLKGPIQALPLDKKKGQDIETVSFAK